MIRHALLSIATLGILGAAAAAPASAQPVWGSVGAGFRVGHVPVGISVGTGPVYGAPAPVVYGGYGPAWYGYHRDWAWRHDYRWGGGPRYVGHARWHR